MNLPRYLIVFSSDHFRGTRCTTTMIAAAATPSTSSVSSTSASSVSAAASAVVPPPIIVSIAIAVAAHLGRCFDFIVTLRR